MPTRIYVYGYGGWEQQIDRHVKTRVIFAIADEKKTQLAWYTYVDNALTYIHQEEYNQVAFGLRKLDRFEQFASQLFLPPPLDVFDFNFSIGGLAPPPGPSHGALGFLDLKDDKAAGTTSCTVFIHAVKRPVILLNFELKTDKKRNTYDRRKHGRVYFLATQQFSAKAIQSGPPKKNNRFDPLSPALGMWDIEP